MPAFSVSGASIARDPPSIAPVIDVTSSRQSARYLYPRSRHPRDGDALLEAFQATLAFLRDWRRSASRACRHQYGILLSVPIVWGCVEAYVAPLSGLPPALATAAAASGFLATALFLEARPGRRLALQALVFSAWILWLGARDAGSPAAAIALPAGKASAGSAPAREGRKPVRLEGTVRGFAQGEGSLVFDLDAGIESWRIMAADPGFPILPGQRLAVSGRRKEPDPPTNPGQFDYGAYLRSLELAGVFRADSISVLAPPGSVDRLVAAARDALRAGLARAIPEAQRPMFEAALLGITSGLDPAVMEDFRASGMLHVLAISGQHVGIMALILLQAFSLLRLPRKAAFAATGAALALYVPVCGGSISVVRSAIMFWCALPAILLERPAKGINTLALAACICLLWMPRQILSLGFQLSFGATYFLLLYSRPLSRSVARMRLPWPLRPAIGYAWPTFALSGVIFLGLLPLLSATVHTVSPTSVAGNLATVGLSSAMILAGCLALLAAPAGWPGALIGESAGLLADWLAGVIRILARLPGSCMSSAGLPPPWSGLLLLLLLAFPFALRRRRGRLLALIGLALFSGRWAMGAAQAHWQEPARAVFLDVGQGDATLLRLPGADILVDAGPADAGRKVILPYLRSQGIDRLDLVILTHPDLDHYGGLAHVAERMSIGKVVHAGGHSEARAWRDLRQALERRGVRWEPARSGHVLYRLEGGRFELSVLGPDREEQFRNRNDNSLICLLRARDARIFLTGDMEKASQASLLERRAGDVPDWTGAILKVPHHGSDRTTDMAFLRAAAPTVAVISAGRRNRFGHPGPETVETLRGLGARLLLTPVHGAVAWSSDRGGESWQTFLPEGGTPSESRVPGPARGRTGNM
jgi:competence protein ComEC